MCSSATPLPPPPSTPPPPRSVLRFSWSAGAQVRCMGAQSHGFHPSRFRPVPRNENATNALGNPGHSPSSPRGRMKGSPWRTARPQNGSRSGASPTHAPAISGGRMELCRSRFPNANEVLVGRAWPPVGVHCLRTPRYATRVSFLCRIQRAAHSRLAHDEVG